MARKFYTFQCYMLASIYNELQRQHEDMEPRAMQLHLIESLLSRVGLRDITYIKAYSGLGW